MNRVILLAIAATALLSGPSLRAQSADEKAVQSYVEDFLLRLGDGKYDTLDADFTPKALVIVARQRNGEWTNSYQTGEEWLAALKKNPNPAKFREPIANVQVTIDSGRLAYLRADFQVVRDGKPVSHGVDQFTLVRDGDRWRIVAIVYTSLPVAGG